MYLSYRRIDPPAVAVAALAAAVRLPLTVAALPGFGNSDEPTNVLVGAHMADTGTLDPHNYRYPGLVYDVIAGVTAGFRAVGLPAPTHGAMRVENLGIAHTNAQLLLVAIRAVGVVASVATCLLVWAAVRGVLAAGDVGAARRARLAGSAGPARPVGSAGTTRPAGPGGAVTPAGLTCATRPVGAARAARPAGLAEVARAAGSTGATSPVGAAGAARRAVLGRWRAFASDAAPEARTPQQPALSPRLAATLAAAAVAVSPLAAANSAYATPDVYAGLAIALALYGATLILRATPHAALVSGLGIGLALGAKYLAAAAIPVLAAYALVPGRRRNALLKTVAVAAATFVVTTPAVLIHPAAVLSGLDAEAIHYRTGHAGAEGGAPGFYLKALLTDQPLLLLAVALAVLALRTTRGVARSTLIVNLAYAVPQYLLLASMTVRFDRNIVPLTPALAILLGVSLPALLPTRATGATEQSYRATAALVAIAAVLPLTAAVRLYPKLDEHSRVQAAAWITHHIPPHKPVAVESYGPWLDQSRFLLHPLTFAADEPQVKAQALVLTNHAAGRFLADPDRYPREAAAYREIMARYQLAARFTDGSWIEVYVPR